MAKRNLCPGCRKTGPNARTSVDYDAMLRSFRPDQMIGKNIIMLRDAHYLEARILSPVRTGAMKKAHYKRTYIQEGLSRKYVVGTSARYARFVIGGTAGNGSGFITGKATGVYGGVMLVRPIPYSYYKYDDSKRFRTEVRGQKAQVNWLKTSLIWALNTVGIIPTAEAVARARKFDIA
jgi:hypothetical protein